MTYQSIFKPDLFSGKVALVTGGGSGMGRCIAHELATLGAEVVIAGRSLEKLEVVQKELTDIGASCHTAQLDIREDALVDKLIADLVGTYGRIDLLVNCAGGQFPSYLEELSANGFNAVVRNNLLGTFLVMRSVFKHSMKVNGGAIVSITMDRQGGAPLLGHAAASRAGMDSMSKTAAVEWSEFGVRVNNVAVGYVESSGLDTYTDQRMLDAIPRVADHTPIGRMGTEAEISAIVCFLLSPAAAYVTGEVVQADGGFSLNHSTPTFVRRKPTRINRYLGFE